MRARGRGLACRDSLLQKFLTLCGPSIFIGDAELATAIRAFNNDRVDISGLSFNRTTLKHQRQGTSLRLATRPWLISTGEYGGSGPPGKARGPGRRRISSKMEPPRAKLLMVASFPPGSSSASNRLILKCFGLLFWTFPINEKKGDADWGAPEDEAKWDPRQGDERVRWGCSAE